MPQISSSKEGAVITYSAEDFIQGLSINGAFNGPSFTSPAIGKGAEQIRNVNPFTSYGVLQPGRGATNVTGNSNLLGVVNSGTVQGSSFAYLLDGGGRISQYNYTNQTITAAGAITHTITGTSPIGQDVLVYKHNISSTPGYSVFYSYYNNSQWNVGAYLNLVTMTDTYMSTVPATPLANADSQATNQLTAPHCLEVGSDDILYIGSGNYVHAYDGGTGADGTFTARVLTLPLGFTIVGLRKYQDILEIAGNYNTDSTNNIGGQALIYQWNYLDLEITQAIDLEDPYVTSLFLWKGVPWVTTVGEIEGRGINKLKSLYGNTVKLETTFDLTPPINRGVDASSDVLLINCGGKIIQLGDQYTGKLEPINHIVSPVTTGISGWVKNLGTNSSGTNYGLIASSATAFSGGTNSLSTFLTNWNASALYLTPYQEIPIPAGKKARLINIIMENFRTYTLGDITFTVYYNFGSLQSFIFANTATLAAPLTKQYKYDSSGNPLKSCTNIGFQLNWSGLATTSSAPPAFSKISFVFEYLDLSANT